MAEPITDKNVRTAGLVRDAESDSEQLIKLARSLEALAQQFRI